MKRSGTIARTSWASRLRRRRGFTLAEVLVASAIMAMIVGAMAVMAMGVEQTAKYQFAQEEAHQHARVALERMQRAFNGAAATSIDPPAAVLAGVSGAYTFPETLVVWKSDANADTFPQANELVVFCANPNNPKQLWEMSRASDTQTVSMTNAAALQTLVDAMKANGATKKTVLTSLVRSCTSHDLGAPKPAVRFDVAMRPSASEWAKYQASTLAWGDLSWAQGMYGTQRGLRQVRLTCELQVLPDDGEGATSPDSFTVPFLGSAAMYYEMKK